MSFHLNCRLEVRLVRREVAWFGLVCVLVDFNTRVLVCAILAEADWGMDELFIVQDGQSKPRWLSVRGRSNSWITDQWT